MSHLKTLLQTRRKNLGFTQAEVALTMGTSYVAVSQLESGKGNHTVSTIMRAAVAYRLSPNTIFAAIVKDLE